MQLREVKTNEDQTVTLEVQVESGQFQNAVEKVFKRRGKSISVPGFRKGKATRKMIEKVYGETVFYDEAVESLINETYPKAAEEAKIQPVDRPSVEVKEGPGQDGFVYLATVPVMPEIVLGQYKGFAVEKVVGDVTEEQVMAEVEKFQKEMGRQVTVEDRAAQEGDTAIIDFEGFMDGKAFPGGKGEGHELVLGSGSFIPGFEDQIIGKKPGDEFEINVTFPEEYHAQELAGKEAVFKCKLHELTMKELPELDDEFAKDVSEFDTLADWKDNIRTKLEEANEDQAQSKMETELLEKVCEDMQGVIPECMFRQRADEMIQEFIYRIHSQGLDFKQYMKYTGMDLETLRRTYLPGAEMQVKTRLALEKIVEVENLTASDEEIAAEYVKLAEQYRMTEDQVKERVDRDTLCQNLAMGKALDIVRDSAVVTVKTAE